MTGRCHGFARAAVAAGLAASFWLPGQMPAASAQDASVGMALASAEPMQLREQPGWDAAALLDLAPGDALEIAGDALAGSDGEQWLPVVAGGVYGFLPAWAVGAAWAPSDDGTGEVGAEQPAGEIAQEEWAADPAAAPEDAAAETWVEAAPADGVTEATDAEAAAASTDAEAVNTAPIASAAYTLFASEDVNLRAAPQPDSDILTVLPAATEVEISGDAVDGFLPVSGGGIDGWIAAEYLVETAPETADPAPAEAVATVEAAPAPDLEPVSQEAPSGKGGKPDANSGKSDAGGAKAERPASVIAFPFREGEWQVIQGYNGGTHTNRSEFAKYKYAIDWARTDGATAGAPIYAPVGGSIGWTDAGSGGLMIDTGQGWGIVLFHVLLDRGVGTGATVDQGQRIGRICSPGDPGYMNADHVETDVWRLNADGSHDSIPFTGEFTIAGYDLPDVGGNNQHMGFEVSA